MTTEQMSDFIADNFTIMSVLDTFGKEVYENNPELTDLNEDDVVNEFMKQMLQQASEVWFSTDPIGLSMSPHLITHYSH